MWLTRELSPRLVEAAYRVGIFPMALDHRDIFTWHCPDPRAILPLDGFHCPRSLSKVLRQRRFEITIDEDFEGVMRGCADRAEGTWINERMIEVYAALFGEGKAHSVEVRRGGRLVGGLYGVHLGGAFMAESKFHRETDTSKVALAALVERLGHRGFVLLDVQYQTPHLARFGVIEIPASEYNRRLAEALGMDPLFTDVPEGLRCGGPSGRPGPPGGGVGVRPG